ncbi:hypothetical protein KFE25_010042 [Diacronema lutheri]|uniref:Kinesin motor domain-containing protein n=1 Tax=Diacronema lutheri TaxID=2081491 RepID=A0A8J5XQ50_DIALT|nr:hypothetical protein KFE25_010042 [Diacronema lutheri]
MAVSWMNNITVAVRVRPVAKGGFRCVHAPEHDRTLLDVRDPDDKMGGSDYLRLNKTRGKRFTFDRVLGEQAQQADVYEATAAQLVQPTLEGFNGTCFAYGATGAGKTHTMMGGLDAPGVVPLAVHELFRAAHEGAEDASVKISMQYIEIYNERIRDLLNPPDEGAGGKHERALDVRESPSAGTFVAGATEKVVSSAAELLDVLHRGNLYRTTEPTGCNEWSSRSHAVLQIVSRSQDRFDDGAPVRRGKLSMIDLAGSERATRTENTGARLNEATNINRSLLSLANCINALADRTRSSKAQHVPYRDSKLTRLLKDSLGGNCLTVMITCVSPAPSEFEETLNSLKYANRAKEIKVVDVQLTATVDAADRQLRIVSELRQEIVQQQRTIARLSRSGTRLRVHATTAAATPPAAARPARVRTAPASAAAVSVAAAASATLPTARGAPHADEPPAHTPPPAAHSGDSAGASRAARVAHRQPPWLPLPVESPGLRHAGVRPMRATTNDAVSYADAGGDSEPEGGREGGVDEWADADEDDTAATRPSRAVEVYQLLDNLEHEELEAVRDEAALLYRERRHLLADHASYRRAGFALRHVEGRAADSARADEQPGEVGGASAELLARVAELRECEAGTTAALRLNGARIEQLGARVHERILSSERVQLITLELNSFRLRALLLAQLLHAANTDAALGALAERVGAEQAEGNAHAGARARNEVATAAALRALRLELPAETVSELGTLLDGDGDVEDPPAATLAARADASAAESSGPRLGGAPSGASARPTSLASLVPLVVSGAVAVEELFPRDRLAQATALVAYSKRANADRSAAAAAGGGGGGTVRAASVMDGAGVERPPALSAGAGRAPDAGPPPPPAPAHGDDEGRFTRTKEREPPAESPRARVTAGSSLPSWPPASPARGAQPVVARAGGDERAGASDAPRGARQARRASAGGPAPPVAAPAFASPPPRRQHKRLPSAARSLSPRGREHTGHGRSPPPRAREQLQLQLQQHAARRPRERSPPRAARAQLQQQQQQQRHTVTEGALPAGAGGIVWEGRDNFGRSRIPRSRRVTVGSGGGGGGGGGHGLQRGAGGQLGRSRAQPLPLGLGGARAGGAHARRPMSAGQQAPVPLHGDAYGCAHDGASACSGGDSAPHAAKASAITRPRELAGATIAWSERR